MFWGFIPNGVSWFPASFGGAEARACWLTLDHVYERRVELLSVEILRVWRGTWYGKSELDTLKMKRKRGWDFFNPALTRFICRLPLAQLRVLGLKMLYQFRPQVEVFGPFWLLFSLDWGHGSPWILLMWTHSPQARRQGTSFCQGKNMRRTSNPPGSGFELEQKLNDGSKPWGKLWVWKVQKNPSFIWGASEIDQFDLGLKKCVGKSRDHFTRCEGVFFSLCRNLAFLMGDICLRTRHCRENSA